MSHAMATAVVSVPEACASSVSLGASLAAAVPAVPAANPPTAAAAPKILVRVQARAEIISGVAFLALLAVNAVNAVSAVDAVPAVPAVFAVLAVFTRPRKP